MSLSLLLVLLAVGASVLLLAQLKDRLLPIIALVASGLQALAAFDILQVKSGVVPVALIFGAAIAVSGLFLWFRLKARIHVTAATVLVMVGGLQVLQSLELI